MTDKPATEKKRILSAIQPSGMLTLGNYLGALKNWVAMQDEYACVYSVADLHAITVRQEPAKLRRQVLETYALLLAIGIDPEKSTLFVQSHVPAHSELAWICNCYVGFGELSRMTQFKEKSAQHADNINAGLFAYPALQAADILLYSPDYVPVGADQKQHVELSRTVAGRFNHLYGDVFKIPEPYIPKTGARIMSLQDPTRKMSKSDENQTAWVALLDKPEDIIRKFKRAVTDSEARVAVGEGKDGVNNLIAVYSAITGCTAEEIETEFEGKGYGDFKRAVGEAVVETLNPIRERYEALVKDKAYLKELQQKGAEKAAVEANRVLRKCQKKIGLL